MSEAQNSYQPPMLPSLWEEILAAYQGEEPSKWAPLGFSSPALYALAHEVFTQRLGGLPRLLAPEPPSLSLREAMIAKGEPALAGIDPKVLAQVLALVTDGGLDAIKNELGPFADERWKALQGLAEARGVKPRENHWYLGTTPSRSFSRTFKPSPGPLKASLSLRCHGGLFAELNSAIALIKQRLATDLAPDDVVIIAPAPYAAPLKAASASKGLSVRWFLPTPLGDASFGLWLSALNAWLEAKTAANLAALLTHPLSLAWLKAAGVAPSESDVFLAMVLNEALAWSDGSLQGVEEPLYAVAGEGLDDEGTDVVAGTGSSRFRSQDLAPNALSLFATLLSPLLGSEPQSLSDWAGFFRDLILAVVKGAERATALCWAEALEPGDEEVSPQLAWAVHYEALMDLTINHVPEATGVAVIDLAAAAFWPARLAVILGAAEGILPPPSPLAAFSLPPELAEDASGIELAALLANVDEAVFCYSTGLDGKSRSRCVEALARQQSLKETGPFIPESMPAALGLRPRLAQEGEWPVEKRWDILKSMSASGLEKLVRCPYSFLLARLGVAEPPSPTREALRRRQGQALHDLLEAFFTGRARGREVAGPLPHGLSPAEFEAAALARLEELTEQLLPEALFGQDLLLQLQRFAWPHFASHLSHTLAAALNVGSSQGLREARFGGGYGKALSTMVGPYKIALEGVIDSVDVLQGAFLLTDYKRLGVASAKDVTSGVAPQLVFYALALDAWHGREGFDLEAAIFGYWDILRGAWHPRGVGSKAKDLALSLGLATPRTTAASELVATLKDLWGWRLEALLQHSEPFAADPSRCDHCRLAGVCRKYDPGFKERLSHQDVLARRGTRDDVV